MPSVRIVTHCYAAELPHYAACLNYQLASIVLFPPARSEVAVTVFFALEDSLTNDVVMFYKERMSLDAVSLPPPKLFRRSIGRNIGAQHNDEDFVWFTDCDHLFRSECLDTLANIEWPQSASICFPRQVMVHRDWTTGDMLTEQFTEPHLADIDPGQFVPKDYRRAIGPAQIVRGSFARKHGYLPNHPRWQKPNPKPFSDFRDDVNYRRECMKHGSMRGINLPGIYRIRHTRTTYQADKQ